MDDISLVSVDRTGQRPSGDLDAHVVLGDLPGLAGAGAEGIDAQEPWRPCDRSTATLHEVVEFTAGLVRHYVRTPSKRLAEHVAASFASLAWHPEVYRDARRHCAFRGMVRHWYWLAGQREQIPTCS